MICINSTAHFVVTIIELKHASVIWSGSFRNTCKVSELNGHNNLSIIRTVWPCKGGTLKVFIVAFCGPSCVLFGLCWGICDSDLWLHLSQPTPSPEQNYLNHLHATAVFICTDGADHQTTIFMYLAPSRLHEFGVYGSSVGRPANNPVRLGCWCLVSCLTSNRAGFFQHMTFVLKFSASKIGSTLPKYVLMHRRLFRCIVMKQPIRPEQNLGSSFQGANLDPTVFKSFESPVCFVSECWHNCRAFLSASSRAGVEREAGVVRGNAWPTLAIKRFLLALFLATWSFGLCSFIMGTDIFLFYLFSSPLEVEVPWPQ